MRLVRNFEEFIRMRVVKSQGVDSSRINFLVNESEKAFDFLEDMINVFGVIDKNAGIIIRSCYDSIMEIIRAVMLKNGFNARGDKAHMAEVSYLREVGFSENDVQFADSLRHARNGIMYYGNNLGEKYARRVFEFLQKIYPKLKELLK